MIPADRLSRDETPRYASDMQRLVPAAIPVLLLGVVVLPYVWLPVPAAIPTSFAGVLTVTRWSSWRQRPDRDQGLPRRVRLPVRGQWHAPNTPAWRIPSHGTHFLAQTYAFDVVAVDDEMRTSPGRNPLAWFRLRRPEAFYAFGRPIVAPGPGRVVAAWGGSRDHRSRDSIPGLALWFVEQFLRSFRGARGLLGNHVILRLDDGCYAVMAHLRRGSLLVDPGDEVTEGQVIAECGNSGNATEPHLHFQLMDHPEPGSARGLAVLFESYEVWHDGEGWTAVSEGVPNRGERIRTR